jgi:hypothetical protein
MLALEEVEALVALEVKRTSSLGWRTGKRQHKLLVSNSNVETSW